VGVEMKLIKSMVYLIIFFAGYGALLELPIGNITIMIPCVTETPEILWFGIPLVTLLDIIITPPFAMIMFYLIYKSLITQPTPDEAKPSDAKQNSIKVVLYGACICFIAGVIMHAVANVLNGFLGNPVPPVGNLQIAIYFFDEVLGHKLIHAGIFAFLIGGMVLQFWHRNDLHLSKMDLFGVYFWPSAIGAVYMLTLVEGQAAFDVLVISLVLIAIILYYMKFRGLKLSENVFTHFVLVLCVAIVVSTIVFGIITGFKPGYPFFHQLNEL
jgi:hypothetical protein